MLKIKVLYVYGKRQKCSKHNNKPRNDGQPDDGQIKRQSTLSTARRRQSDRLVIDRNAGDAIATKCQCALSAAN